MTIKSLSFEAALQRKNELEALMHDAVSHGASIGYLHPMEPGEAAAYWTKIIGDLQGPTRVLLAAVDDDGRLVGSAQLALESRPNGRHRAEVQKVLVLNTARRRGIGASLMHAIEAEAARCGRTLLFLDTSVGSGGASEFYANLGYTLTSGIPDYAMDPDGTLKSNAIFYKRLKPTSA
ncbi:MAG: GNAT family N-acetyltransferase [Opitutus sp.]